MKTTNTAFEMYSIHTDARQAIAKLAKTSGIDEKSLLEMFVEVMTNELNHFKPESGERLTEEEAEKAFATVE